MWEQDLGRLHLWGTLTAQRIPVSKQGSGKTDKDPSQATMALSQPPSLPHHWQLSPKSIDSPQQSATFHQGKNPTGKASYLVNLEMSEHTTQAIIIASIMQSL